jgi:hypothetical protein
MINHELYDIEVNSKTGVAAALEAQRLSEKYGKDFFDADDIVKITGVGKNNIGRLFRNELFPTIQIGNRKVVSALAFTLWSLTPENVS